MHDATPLIRTIRLSLPAIFFCLIATGATFADAPPKPGRWEWATPAQFDECYRDRYLDNFSDPAAAKLVHQIVISDEMGKEYNEYQPVTRKTQAKKILMLDDADVSNATLFVGGWSADCEILVNGTVLGIKPPPRTYWTGEFDVYAIPPKLLKKGANEFVFRALPGKEGSIRIETCEQPARSAVSHDGGASWDFEHMAEGGFCKGEFEVRLNVGRYAPKAWLRSPVLDLSAPGINGPPIAIPGTAPRITKLKIDADTPGGTSIETMIRTGPTPDGNEESWSRWYAWPAEKDQVPPERFAQWQLVLQTTKAQKTPVVHRVTLITSLEQAAPPAFFQSLRVDDSRNEKIVRSSYDFAYGDYNGKVVVLRKNWDLAGAVASGATQLDKFKLLRQWVRNQWNNGWDEGSLHYIPSWDARIILTLASRNMSLGMCTHYATTYVQCSQALGYTSRSIFWGHALSESWSDELKKWVVMDAGLDMNGKRRATYHFERNGVALNQMEVHNAYYIDKNWRDIKIVATNMSASTAKVEPPFPDLGTEYMMKACQEIFMPLRNNFIDHREPEEPEHGQGYFKFLGFINWKDAVTPAVPWTDFFTTRQADLYWTLDQAQVFLAAPADGDKRELSVMLDTVTPNFAGYEYRIDGNQWTTWNAPPPNTPAAAATSATGVEPFPMKPTGGCIEFPWRLHTGTNTLEVRPFNKANQPGIISTVVVEAAA